MFVHKFSPTHSVIGLTLISIGTIGVGQAWLGQFGTLLFVGIIVLGTLWCSIPGGLGLLIFPFVAMPFFILAYVLFLPVKKRGDKSYRHGFPVVAYWIRDDRIVLVLNFTSTISGQSFFRGRRKLARMREILDSTNVPEHPLVEEQLNKSVEIWNQDTELRRKFEQRGGIDPGPSEALIVLDEHSEERANRVHSIIDCLWDWDKYQDMRHEIIQLAIWDSLAADVSCGENRGIWFWKEYM